MKKILICILALLTAIGCFAALSTGAVDDVGDYPAIVSITAGSKGFAVGWTPYEGAAKYRLFYKSGSGWKKIGDTAGTSMNHLGLSDDTEYTYTVRALNGNGKYISRYNAEGWTKTYYAAPVITSVTPSGDALKISWKKSGTGWWMVYRLNGTSWKSLGFSDSGSYLDPDVVSGNSYTYTVRRYSDDRTEKVSAYNKTGVTAKFVAVPRITSTASCDGFVRIKWDTVTGAKKYRVFCRYGTRWAKIGDTASNYFDYRVSGSMVYATFTVRAMDGSGAYISDYDHTGATHKYLASPELLSVANTFSGQKLSWKSRDGAEKYRVFTKSAGGWKALANVDGTSYTINDLENGTDYTYTVRCVSYDGSVYQSYYDKNGITCKYYSSPVISSVKNQANGASISFNGTDGAASYRVFSKVPGGWQKLGDVSSTTFLHETAEDCNTYKYTVRAMNEKGRYISGYDTSGYENTYYAPPRFVSATPVYGNIKLTWEAREGISNYRVYRREFAGSWKRIVGSVTATEYTDKKAPKNVPYQYTLRCLDENGDTVSGYLEDNIYFYNGELADGSVNFNGYSLTFKDGVYLKGYVSAQDIINIALAEVGTKATYLKKCKYNTWYWGREVSGDMYDWCGVFVNWVFNEAGAYDILKTKAANCGAMGRDFRDNGILVTSDYQPGDVILFSYSNYPSTFLTGFNSLDHVGICVSVNDDGTITTVDGNYGLDINGEVSVVTRKLEYVECAGRPAYGYVNSADNSKSDLASTSAYDEPADGILPGGEYRLRESEYLD